MAEIATRVLLEDTWQFCPDRTKITESKVETTLGLLTSLEVPGTLSLCNVKNGNGRIYPTPVWETNTKEGSHLQKLITCRQAWGTLEHPKEGKVDLTSPIAVSLIEAKLEADGRVTGKFLVLTDLTEGNKLRVLINQGWDPLVSSRGYGSLVKRPDGLEEVQNDFICEGWDVVSAPSFTQAQLEPKRESVTAIPISGGTQQVPPPILTTTATSAPVVEHRVQGDAKKPITEKVNKMELKDIRIITDSLKATDISKAKPAQIAEGFTRVTELNRHLAELKATEPKSAWDCERIQEELKDIEQSWSKKLQAPKDEAARLSESRNKAIALAEATVKTAKLYRDQLAESAKKTTAKDKLFETIASRGRGWKALAEKRAATLEDKEHKINVTCVALDKLVEKLNTDTSALQHKVAVATTALDKLTEQYNADTTDLARKLVMLEHSDVANYPDLKKSLEEAKTSADVLDVKNKLLEKKGITPIKPVTPADKGASKVMEGVTVLPSNNRLGDQLNLMEMLGVAKRMNGAQVTVKA